MGGEGASSVHHLQKRQCPHRWHRTSAIGALGSSRHSTSQTASSAVAKAWPLSLARQHQMAITLTMTMLKWLLSVFHRHRTFQFHHPHCCWRPPVVRSVSCLHRGWLQTESRIGIDCTRPLHHPLHHRCTFWLLMCFSACHSARCLLLCRATAGYSIQLAINFLGGWDRFSGKFLYLQIPLLLPVLPNFITCKFSTTGERLQ